MMEESINELVKEHIEQIEEIDMFGKKASSNLESALSSHYQELVEIANELQAALGKDNLQQVASRIVKRLRLKFRNMDR
tara:strand:+ start:2647 stop:2883 length:237 start_codon:yes stop_codon:yes gene_type:complete